MRNIKTLVILGLVTLVVVLAALFIQETPTVIEGSGDLMFPDMRARVNDANEIKVSHQSETVTVVRRDHSWVVLEKSNYPAAEDRVRQYLIGLAQLRRLEPKTRKPERYTELGLDDIGEKNTKSAHVSVTDSNGGKIADLIVGDRRPAKSDPSESELFVRMQEDPQSWLVEGKLPNYYTTTDWLDKTILKLDRKRIREVNIIHEDGEEVAVRRQDKTANDFQLLNVPKEAKVKSTFAINSIANAFADLTLDDVLPETEKKIEAGAGLRAELTTFDGLRIIMETVKDDDDTFARFIANFDPTLIADKKAHEAAEADSDKSESRSGQPPEGKDAEAVKNEVERLNTRWQGWSYKLPSYRINSIAKRRNDLLEVESKQSDNAGASTGEAMGSDVVSGKASETTESSETK
jgi:hypothetical protein